MIYNSYQYNNISTNYIHMQVAGATRLVQRFHTGSMAVTALRVPLVTPSRSPVHPASICVKDVASGHTVFHSIINFTHSQPPHDKQGWVRIPLDTPLKAGRVYDLAITAAKEPKHTHDHPGVSVSTTWPTRSLTQGGGGRLETWGYVHAGTPDDPDSGKSDDQDCNCAQSESVYSSVTNNTLAARLQRGMMWQLGLAARKDPGGGHSYGVLAVPDAYYNGVPATGVGSCSASSMWDQVPPGCRSL